LADSSKAYSKPRDVSCCSATRGSRILLNTTIANHIVNTFQHQCRLSAYCLTLWRLGGFDDFRKKIAVFGCLTNALAPPPIAKYYHLTVGAQGQAKWAKVAYKSSTYDVTHKKPAPPRQKNFLRVQSTRLADPFEPLNSSLAQSAEELGRW